MTNPKSELRVTARTGCLLAITALGLAGCLSPLEKEVDPTAHNEPDDTLRSVGGIPENRAPIVGAQPVTSAVVGDTYVYEPEASDPDGDDLSYTIENKPEWASFDRSTGRMSGTPQAGHEGRWDNIRVKVSDGIETTTKSFAVLVTSIGTASVTLNWTAPTENDDGSPLTDLAGYKIYYGSESGVYDQQIDVDNPGITTYVVDSLNTQSYFFVATAYNYSGIESDYTNEVEILAN